MNKPGRKPIDWIVIAVAAVALISVIAVAYAQEDNDPASNKNMMDMMGGKGMDVMHKQMTKNLDSDLKEQMDKVHEQCKKLHNDETLKKGMMQQNE